ncbi:MAG: choice-of-anchor O protein, partial [Campylobacterota bacterium]
ITTYVAEQITSGRRDALQIFLASSPGGQGFGFTWQEDPEGLRPGSGKGPGAGWGGATTNHKTDIWYSYIAVGDTDNFSAIDEDFVPSGNVDQDQIATDAEDIDDNVTTRPHVLNKFVLPVRISNNAVCSEDNVNDGTGAKYCATMCEKYGVYNNVNDVNDTSNGKCYGPGIDPITGEQFVLDGDTGASRPNIFIQPGKYNGESRAIAIFGYEETKGLGDGAPEDAGIPTEGTSDTNWTDTGKYVIYESFPFDQPEVLGDSMDLEHVVSGGHILNVPNSEGIYENARRVRFIPQGMKSMETSEQDIVLGAVYKEGMEGQGRPSDIMLARFKKGYAFSNLVPGRINISSVTPTVTDEDANTTKVLEWEWTTENLNDESATNPYDDARAHRGQIRGDFLIVGYSYTPNWAAARIAHDKYDFYVRRSFDGGNTWTTADGNTSEGPVNVSNLANNKETVIEPRLVATPGTILTDGVLASPKDKQNKNIYFITYGTAENVPNVVGSIDEDEDIEPGAPLDLYYARTTDRGETYEMVEKTIISDDSNFTEETVTVMDWFAHSGAEEGEVQIRMTPDGSVFYGSWIQESDMDNVDIPDHFKGSDIWFRKIDYNLAIDDNETE